MPSVLVYMKEKKRHFSKRTYLEKKWGSRYLEKKGIGESPLSPPNCPIGDPENPGISKNTVFFTNGILERNVKKTKLTLSKVSRVAAFWGINLHA